MPRSFVRACVPMAPNMNRNALTLTGVPAEMPQASGNSRVACTARNRPQNLHMTGHSRARMSMLLVRAAGTQHGTCTHRVQLTHIAFRTQLRRVRLLHETLTL